MSNGLDATGFTRKRLDEIILDTNTEFQSVFGDNLNIAPESPDGQIIGTTSGSQADLWEIAEEVYNQFNPSVVANVGLSNLVQLNGITRAAAVASTATLTVTGTNGTPVLIGSLVSTPDGSVTFVTDVEVIIPVAGFIDVEATATATGEIPAVAGTLTIIDTPITGWTSVTNAADAVLGSDEESDPELRARRERSVAKAAKGILETIIAEVLEVDAVDEAFIFENKTLITDPITATPGKAFQVVVLGGDDDAIAQAIFDEKPIGIEPFGTTLVPILDSQGTLHDIGITRPSVIDIYIIVNTETTSEFPVDGGDTIKQNIVDYANGVLVQGRGFGVDDDIIQTELFTPVNSVVGNSPTSILIGIAPTPTLENDIPIDFDEVSDFVIGNIIVNETPV